jgi:hypothetical protein
MTRDVLGNWPLVIIGDADNKRNGCCERVFPPDANVFDDGVFRLDSKLVPGLQLADLAAFPLNRIHHIRARREQGRKPAPFDGIIEGVLRDNWEKYRCVLDRIHSDDAA